MVAATTRRRQGQGQRQREKKRQRQEQRMERKQGQEQQGQEQQRQRGQRQRQRQAEPGKTSLERSCALDVRRKRLIERRNSWRKELRQQISARRQKSSVARHFLALTRGFTAADWMLMHHFNDLRNKVYFYNHEDHECVKGDKRVQWPVVWTLARYHLKHIFF